MFPLFKMWVPPVPWLCLTFDNPSLSTIPIL